MINMLRESGLFFRFAICFRHALCYNTANAGPAGYRRVPLCHRDRHNQSSTVIMDPIRNRAFKRAEQFLGPSLLGLIVLGCLIILRPFFSSILWATILCYATWPACEWLVKHMKGHRSPAALVMTILLVLVIALPFALIGGSLASSVEHLLVVVRRLNAEGIPTPPEWVTTLPWVGEYLEAHWSDLALNADRTTELLRQLLLYSRGWLIRNSLELGHGIVQIFLSVVIAYFFYRDGHEVARRVTDVSNRVFGEYTQHLIGLAGTTIRSVVYGLLGTALGQGIMAAIGFVIVGLPAPFFWALMVVLLSFMPFGPPIIWIGATIWLLFQSGIGWAVFMAIWGLVGISGIDNVLRPYLISRNAQLSFLMVMLGVLGGVLVFGLLGLFLGPTLLAVGLNIAKEFAGRPPSAARKPAPTAEALPPAAPEGAVPEGATADAAPEAPATASETKAVPGDLNRRDAASAGNAKGGRGGRKI